MDEQLLPSQDKIANERQTLLQQLQDWLEAPMLVLAFIWLALLVVEIVWGLSPLLETVGYIIWAVFIFDLALELWLAPLCIDKWTRAARVPEIISCLPVETALLPHHHMNYSGDAGPVIIKIDINSPALLKAP